ncbi:divalent-cation tolerance protein CutA [Caminibacter mediatlanticus TB-2]|uniref:Divalent-cation tolerance protein CutA n=1 Tax=Caminibacter mediatlanticus TB-2 TaxID=391592 RepID=A0ABX5V765_9BACT|nr:divalent-cation tolerance protein CutA [Caminibacter mediatlanticus]QCT94066.1 divalent-cation tolerance protein CutA [Caminibacter mediatlanticus TB-2]
MLVMTTASNFEEAKKIAKYLVENHYAACVNIFPITSIYFWDNKLQEDNECMLFIKTAREFEEIKNIIKKIHSYELPEIIKINIEGEEEYIEWIKRFSK